MTTRTKLITIAALLLMLTMPMAIYNQYHILKAVGATQLMWFFWYAIIPVSIVLKIIGTVIESIGDKK